MKGRVLLVFLGLLLRLRDHVLEGVVGLVEAPLRHVTRVVDGLLFGLCSMEFKIIFLYYTSWAYPCVASVPPPHPDFYFQLCLSLSCPHVFGNPVILLIWQRCLWRRKIWNSV